MPDGDSRGASLVDAQDVRVLLDGGVFDADWYSRQYPDAARLGMSAAEHYLWLGRRLNRPMRAEGDMALATARLRWVVVATGHTLFIADLLCDNLKRLGWSCVVLQDMPDVFDCDYYIVLCAQMFDRLPPGEKRIIYQLEQAQSSRWFTDKYVSDMENSLAVLEYSRENLPLIAQKGLSYPHVYLLPIGASASLYEHEVSTQAGGAEEKRYDILFYGDYKSCSRRRDLLDKIPSNLAVKRVDSLFGEEMRNEIRAAKVVLNLHYYADAKLEMPRIQECLSLGVPVISEMSSDALDYPDLAGAVVFFEEGSVEGMLSALERVFPHAFGHPRGEQAPIHFDIAGSIERSRQNFSFMLERMLIGIGILPIGHVDRLSPISLSAGTSVCLSLPETHARRALFLQNNVQNNFVFDGIRRRPGWLGCGSSYKYLAKSALKSGLSELLVMEDDVEFFSDFPARMTVIRNWLDQNIEKWDVFCGIIASIHPDTKVEDVCVYGGETFIAIDRMTSMVFNIYNKTALRALAAWNPENEDVHSNTIDRFLENLGLRVVTVEPFAVGHREDANSTLWGFGNAQYNPMFDESTARLRELRNNWEVANAQSGGSRRGLVRDNEFAREVARLV